MRASEYQLTEMLEHCVGFAKAMLEKAGEFHSFGAEIGPLGAMTALGFWTGEELPPGQDLYQFALKVMARKASEGSILACAIGANVNIPPAYEAQYSDGIRVQIETSSYARLIYLPYGFSKRGLLGRKREVVYGEMFAIEIEPAIFRN